MPPVVPSYGPALHKIYTQTREGRDEAGGKQATHVESGITACGMADDLDNSLHFCSVVEFVIQRQLLQHIKKHRQAASVRLQEPALARKDTDSGKGNKCAH